MSYSKSTPNFKLPDWMISDKPSWFADVAPAFGTIDGAMQANKAAAAAANELAQSAKSDIAAIDTSLATLQTSVETIHDIAETAQTTAASALTTANAAESKAEEALENAGMTPAQVDQLNKVFNASFVNASFWNGYIQFPSSYIMLAVANTTSTATTTICATGIIKGGLTSPTSISLRFNSQLISRLTVGKSVSGQFFLSDNTGVIDITSGSIENVQSYFASIQLTFNSPFPTSNQVGALFLQITM